MNIKKGRNTMGGKKQNFPYILYLSVYTQGAMVRVWVKVRDRIIPLLTNLGVGAGHFPLWKKPVSHSGEKVSHSLTPPRV